MHPWLSEADQDRVVKPWLKQFSKIRSLQQHDNVPSSNVTHQAELLEKLRSRQALIGIVGLGYVGLPLALTYAEVGYRVLA